MTAKIEKIQHGDDNNPSFGFVVTESADHGDLQSQAGRVGNLSPQYQGAGGYGSENVDTNFNMQIDNHHGSGTENMAADLLGSPEIQIHSQGISLPAPTVVSSGTLHSSSNEHMVTPVIQVTGVNEETQVGNPTFIQ
jgi:hypothetical protein